MAKSNRIESINSKISLLQARKKKVESKRGAQLLKILTRCGADKLPQEILAGALVEAVRAYAQNDNRISAWKSDGKTILKPGRGRKKFI